MINGFSNQPLTAEAARKLQSLDLEDKFLTTIEKIGEWEVATGGQWYVSFSGGKDSTVLAYIAARFLASYRTPPHPLHLLFCDTGLEYPEIRQFAMSFSNFLQKRFPTVTVDFSESVQKGIFLMSSNSMAIRLSVKKSRREYMNHGISQTERKTRYCMVLRKQRKIHRFTRRVKSPRGCFCRKRRSL